MRFVNSKTVKQAAALVSMVVLATQSCGSSSGGSAQRFFRAGGTVQITSSGVPSFGHAYAAHKGNQGCRWTVYTVNKYSGAQKTIKRGDYGNASLNFPSAPNNTRVFIKSNSACGQWDEVK